MRSPQSAHRLPSMGRMANRQSWQTGRREILTRGVPQRRQSPGNNVANKPSAAAVTQETSAVSAATTLALTARVKSSLLLKTTLPTRTSAHSGRAERILMKYSCVYLGHATLSNVPPLGCWTRTGSPRLALPSFASADENRAVATLEAVGTTVRPQQ